MPLSNTLATRRLLELLRLPTIGPGLTAEQIRGARCVWCATGVNGETAVDFGLRPGPAGDAAWYPRACETCVQDHARRMVASHRGNCRDCSVIDLCETGKALRELVKEVGA